MKIKAFAVFAAVSACAAAGQVKISERFGFDPEDSTRFIQQALDSGLPEIVLDRQNAAWVTKPLRGRSNQTLYFEEDVELLAKPGEFHGKVDALIRYENVTNVAIVGMGARGGVCRMRKGDYQRAPYVRSEWRHGVFFVNAVNFRIENMMVVESGGDGVDILGKGCRNGVVRRVVCDRNHRQGLSVEGCTGLLIEDCVFSNTQGTPPSAGVDFEPFKAEQPMTGIVMRNCRIEGNAGNGIDLWAGMSDGKTPPYDITVENCRVVGGKNGIRIGTGIGRITDDPRQLPQGHVTFTNCVIEKCERYGIAVDAKPHSAFRLEFIGCSLHDVAGGEEDADVRLRGKAGKDGSNMPDNIAFRDLTVLQPHPRPWVRCVSLVEMAAPHVRDITGNVRVIGANGKHQTIDVKP